VLSKNLKLKTNNILDIKSFDIHLAFGIKIYLAFYNFKATKVLFSKSLC